jgi:hypothetical protein
MSDAAFRERLPRADRWSQPTCANPPTEAGAQRYGHRYANLDGRRFGCAEPLLLFATGIMEAVPAHAMSITCMPLYGHAVYNTMCIVYHDDGSVERFFVRP